MLLVAQPVNNSVRVEPTVGPSRQVVSVTVYTTGNHIIDKDAVDIPISI